MQKDDKGFPRFGPWAILYKRLLPKQICNIPNPFPFLSFNNLLFFRLKVNLRIEVNDWVMTKVQD